MSFTSNFQSRINEDDRVKLGPVEKEWSWVRFGTLSLFSFNIREEIPDVWENISVGIQFISDQSSWEAEQLVNEGHLNVDILADRLKKGDICCCASFQGETVSYCWIAASRAHIGEIGKEMRLKENEIYLYDAYTKPEFRGNNLCPKILTSILNYGRLRGYQRVLIFALSSNSSSITAIKKAGFDRFQSVYFLDIYCKTLCRFGEVKPGALSIEERFVI